jgi:hypothetical protein
MPVIVTAIMPTLTNVPVLIALVVPMATVPKLF